MSIRNKLSSLSGQYLPQPAWHWLKRVSQRTSYKALRTMRIQSAGRLAKMLGEYADILHLANSDLAKSFPSSGSAGKVLFFTSLPGMLNLMSFELALYRLLERKDYDCDVVICDKYMSICEMMNANQSISARHQVCTRCYFRGQDTLDSVNVPYINASELVDSNVENITSQIERELEMSDASTWPNLVIDGVPIGQIALASTLRFLRRGTLPNPVDADTRQTLLSYIESAIRIKVLAEAYLRQSRPNFVVMTHGIYVPWGPARSVFEREGIPVLCYDQSNVFRNAYVASWNKPSQDYDISVPFAQESGQTLSENERQELRGYLASRRDNSRDRTRFNFVPEEGREIVRGKLNIPFDVPCFGLFTNLLWDAATVGRDICFTDQMEWIIETIRHFEQHPDRYLIVRAHPAEGSRGTRQSVFEVISQSFSVLPSNVRFIGKVSAVNAYSVYNAIDVGIVNTSTVGLEMSLIRKPVIVASTTHYRGKGFTWDPLTRTEYFNLIDTMTAEQQLSDEQLAEAERYAYMYFFRHHIHPPFFEEHHADSVRGSIRVGRIIDQEPSFEAKLWLDMIENRKPFVLPRKVGDV